MIDKGSRVGKVTHCPGRTLACPAPFHLGPLALDVDSMNQSFLAALTWPDRGG